jgi:predicted acylesterase/phospholipase RssA
MIQVGTIMENMILNLRLEAEPADIIINPDLGDIQFMDFTGAKELITRGQKATEYQQEKIYRLFESRNKPEEKHGE